ncbi:MAG: aldo/keto reductase [Herpetosiphonaceae bacterium]|nr:aldo/keto reductase [Herpetosiphonaceae bacterium]
MRYRKLGRTGLKVSELCLGTMTFGWSVEETESHAIMDMALERGINFFDTADVYSRWDPRSYAGKTEEIMGRWFAADPARRHNVVLATKVRGQMGEGPNDQGLSRRHIMDAVDASLRRLQTDYIDLYQTHSPDDETPIDETLRALDDLVHSGKVRYIGCSNHKAWHLMEALWTSDTLKLARYDSLQPHYNLLTRAEFERELQPVCLKYGIGVMVYSPLAGGLLTGKFRRGQAIPEGTRVAERGRDDKRLNEHLWTLMDTMEELASDRGATIPQLAVAWVTDAPAITTSIIGATSVRQLEDTLGAVGMELTAADRARLNELTAW